MLAVLGFIICAVIGIIIVALVGTGIMMLAIETDWFLPAFATLDVLAGIVIGFMSYSQDEIVGNHSILGTAIWSSLIAVIGIPLATFCLAYFGSLIMGAFLEELEMRDSLH